MQGAGGLSIQDAGPVGRRSSSSRAIRFSTCGCVMNSAVHDPRPDSGWTRYFAACAGSTRTGIRRATRSIFASALARVAPSPISSAPVRSASNSPAATDPGVDIRASHRVVRTVDGSRATLCIDQAGILGRWVGRLYGGLARGYVQMVAAGLKRRSEESAPRTRL